MQITCNTSSAYHVQHIVRPMALRDSPTIKFNRDAIISISGGFCSVLFVCLFVWGFFALAETINR